MTVIVLFISACGDDLTHANDVATPTRQALETTPGSEPTPGNMLTATQTPIPNAAPATSPAGQATASPVREKTATPDPSPSATPTAVPNLMATATPLPVKTAMPTPTPVVMITPIATSTATPAPTPVTPISLSIWSPMDGAGVEAGAIRVMGMTSAPLVDINGISVSVATDGRFQHDLVLVVGENRIEITASEHSGRAQSQQLEVFLVTTTAGLPFTLLYPSDGIEVSEAIVDVVECRDQTPLLV